MSEPNGLLPEDISLLTDLSRGNDWMRALLCTLARRGTWLRRADPLRARSLINGMTPWPMFKTGQFLFDLMEWEDFMVNGPAPELLEGALNATSLARITRLLQLFSAQLDGSVPADIPEAAVASARLPIATDLPDLEPGFYLYQDVVLGIVISVEASRRTS